MFLLPAAALLAQSNAFDPAIFKAPPAMYRGHAMWNFNLSTLNEPSIVSGIQEMAKLNYGGFFIEAGGGQNNQGVGFLSDEYFRFYKIALEEAKKQGLEVILYDDYAFPTGTAGGQPRAKYPQYAAKNLDMTEKDVTGPAQAELAIPTGIYMGAVMMNRDTFELVDISSGGSAGRLVCQVPRGNWKVMAFFLTEGRARIVDYLDETAMNTFISMTYEKYQANLGSYFGNLITQTTTSLPCTMPIACGRRVSTPPSRRSMVIHRWSITPRCGTTSARKPPPRAWPCSGSAASCFARTSSRSSTTGAPPTTCNLEDISTRRSPSTRPRSMGTY